MSYSEQCKLVFSNIKGEDIPDEVYFMQRPGYLSNSGIGYINPYQDFGKDVGPGSPYLFKHKPKFKTTSLAIGSAVHEILLQPDDFILSDYEGKPAGKLGDFVDKVLELREKGMKLEDAMLQASVDVDYYAGKFKKGSAYWTKAIQEGLDYYVRVRRGEFKHPTKEVIVLPKKMLQTAKNCIKAYNHNFAIQNILKPNLFEPKQLLNEIALYTDITVTLPCGTVVPLKFKGKLDSVVIDPEKKIIYLNDLKTTSSSTDRFMGRLIEEQWYNGSFEHHCYYRQLYIYGLMLQKYCHEVLGLTDYVVKANIFCMETTGEQKAVCFPISQGYIDAGKEEFKELICRIAFHETYGYDRDYPDSGSDN